MPSHKDRKTYLLTINATLAIAFNKVWYFRWPATAKMNIVLPQGGWFEFYKLRKSISRQVQQCLKDLAARNYHRDEVSDEEFSPFLKLEEMHPLGPHLVLEDLRNVLDSDRYWF